MPKRSPVVRERLDRWLTPSPAQKDRISRRREVPANWPARGMTHVVHPLGSQQKGAFGSAKGLEATLTVGGGDLVVEPLVHPVPLAEQVDLCPAARDRAKPCMSRHPPHHLPRFRAA